MATLLVAKGDTWQLEIVGRYPKLPAFINQTPRSSINYSGVNKMTRLCVTTNALIDVAPGEAVDPLFFEEMTYDIHFEKSDLSTKVVLPAGAEHRRSRGLAEHYTLNFRSSVGFADVCVESKDGNAKIRIEVFSRKIDYRTDYMAMRDEVSSILRNLAMAANPKTFSLGAPTPGSGATLIEWFALIQNNFDHFIELASQLSRLPHSKLERTLADTRTDRARIVSRKTLDRALRNKGGGPVHPRLAVRLPNRLAASSAQLVDDTPENRYIKALIVAIQRTIRVLVRTNISGDEDADRTSDAIFFESIRPKLKAMERRIEAIIRYSFLAKLPDVGVNRPHSMVFHSNPIYRRFDLLCRMLASGLSLLDGAVPVGIKNTALLYEYWVFLKIVALLSARFQLESQSVLKFRRTRLVVALEKGRASALVFRHPSTRRSFQVIYNRVFARLPTLAQKPDNVIQLASDSRFYIFDAKYRVQFDDDYIARHGSPGPMEEDINTMHRYRDAIAIPHPITQVYQRGVVLGAVAIFPYPNETDYIGHRFHKSIDMVEIGGLPCIPGATSLLEAKLSRIVEAECGR